MKKITIALLILCLTPFSVSAGESGMPLDRAPVDITDNASLQRGAESFVNYCLTCHGASYMRYNRHRDIGFTNEEILNKLVFTWGEGRGERLRRLQQHRPRHRIEPRSLARRAHRIAHVLDLDFRKRLLAPFLVVGQHGIVQRLALLARQLDAGAHAIGAPAVLAVV